MSVRSLIRKAKSIMNLGGRFQDDGTNNVTNHSELSTPPFDLLFQGNENSLDVHPSADLTQCKIHIRGNHNIVQIEKGCHIRGTIFINGAHSTVIIHEGTSTVGMRISGGDGRTVRIGKDCMFSRNVEIRSWDEHPIYDLDTRELINPGADVEIGDHVWLGEGVTINKGVKVAAGCVIGAGSTVTKTLREPNAVYAGTPAMLIRTRVAWSRSPKFMDWETVDYTPTGKR